MSHIFLFVISYQNNTQQLVKELTEQPFASLVVNQQSQQLEHCRELVCIKLPADIEQDSLKQQLELWANKYKVDYWLTEQLYTELPRLIVFDMDSTLIPVEVIDELAEHAGAKQQVSAITELAMQGELDFDQSLLQRVAVLKGMSSKVIKQVANSLAFNEGVEKFCQYILDDGGQLAIASGGFMPFAEHLQTKIPFKYLAANRLRFIQDSSSTREQGVLSGEVEPPIINSERKAECLETWRQSLSLTERQTMAVGDGANDLPMLKRAAIGVAYHAKPAVNKQASAVLRYGEMDVLIELLNFSKAIALNKLNNS